MKLIIEITSFENIDRRRLNNLLANCESEIHHFITKGNSAEVVLTPNMGIEKYMCEVKIDYEKHDRNKIH